MNAAEPRALSVVVRHADRFGNRNFKGYFCAIGKVPKRSRDVNHASQRSEDERGQAARRDYPAVLHRYFQELRQLGTQMFQTRRGPVFRTPSPGCRTPAEFGYPIMVTPLSQFVGSQAALNVIVGEHYKEVTDQVIRYALGRAGQEGARLMDPNVKDKILERPRAREIAAQEPVESAIDEMRTKLGGEGVSDEELLLRWLLSEEEIAAMRAATPPQEYVSIRAPVVALVEELTKRVDVGQIKVQKGDVSLTLEKRI